MPTFEFRDYSLDMTIAGNDFKVNCISELADKTRKHKERLTKLGAEISEGTKTSSDAIDACKDITDDILGTGAFEKIFEGRIPSVTDCSDVLLFVVGEITDYFKKNSGNWAARRSAAKSKTAGGKK